MKKVFLILSVFLLSACTSGNYNYQMPTAGIAEVATKGSTKLKYKDYEVLGTVRGEYQRNCFLLDLFCFGDAFIYDDLVQKSIQMGGNTILYSVVDEERSSLFWTLIYSQKRMKANALAIKVRQDFEKPNSKALTVYAD